MATRTDAPVIAMRGAGYYSANTVGAKAVIDAAALQIELLQCSVERRGRGPFFDTSLEDLACADLSWLSILFTIFGGRLIGQLRINRFRRLQVNLRFAIRQFHCLAEVGV